MYTYHTYTYDSKLCLGFRIAIIRFHSLTLIRIRTMSYVYVLYLHVLYVHVLSGYSTYTYEVIRVRIMRQLLESNLYAT